jgi:hypothetical protein
MAKLNDLITAVRKGDTEKVSSLAEKLVDEDVNISSALKLARFINKQPDTEGDWQDIVDILEEYFE